LSWTAGDSETLWNIEVVDVTAGETADGSATHSGVTNPYSLTGLSSNNEYEFYVQADCGGGDLSTWTGPESFYTGYCVPSSTSSSTYINSFSTTGANVDVDNASTGYTSSGYGDYSQGTAIETFPSGSFDFSASIVGGTAGFAVWIDLNNDLVFDTTTEVFYNTTGYSSGPFTGTIEIPSDLAEGNYRLRMMVDYSDSNPSAATGDSACSFNGTRGEVEDYTVSVGAVPTDAMDWNNLQWLQPTADGAAGSRTSLTVDAGTSISAYAQGYEGGVTDTTAGSAGAGIECWIGIHNENTDPATWPASAWSVATFDSEQGNNDEYKFTTTDAAVGTNYVASRWRLNNAGFTYGGTNPSDPGQTPGGPWDGTTNLSIQLIVNPIANDDCSGAIALTVNSDLACGTVTSGSVEFATDSGSTNTCSMFAHADDDVWYSFVATSESHVVSLSNVSGSATDMYHALYAGDCNTLGDPIKCSDSNTSETTGLTIGNTYYVQVYTYTSTAGQNTSFDICVGTPPPPPANDNCSGVIDLASLTSPITGSTAYASNDFILDCLSNTSAKDVIYSIQVPAGATLSIGQTSNSYDSKHSLRYGDTCPGDQLIVCTDDSDTQTETWVNNTGADQTVYWIQSAFSTGSGDYTLSWTMTPLSVDDQTLKQFTYFPNPVNDVLTINAQKDVDNITVYNMLGQVVKQQTPKTRDCTVDLSAMQTGAYFVQVSIENTVETVRILKN
ncbi:MAG: GEVED domain-containing protein, partial [Flavobacteriaceae bacterium]